jgi:hypothetical protein
MSSYKPVNWYDEGLQKFYGDNNEGKIFGIYTYDDVEQEDIIDVTWYKSETKRDSELYKLCLYKTLERELSK